ncbi:MAG: secretin N-terminal domain-containing protein [Phycisphaerales bacterium]
MRDTSTHQQHSLASVARFGLLACALVLCAGTATSLAQTKPEEKKQEQPASKGPAVARPVQDPVQDVKERLRKAQEAAAARPNLNMQQGGQQIARPGEKQPQNPMNATPGMINQVPGQVAQPAANQPTEFGGVAGDDELVTLSDFREPVQLTSLIELVAQTLQINISIKGDVQGAVTFNAPVPVKKSELIDLLDMLLEQQGWTIVKDRFGIYNVVQMGEIKSALATERPTTRIFHTPNVRPSSLRPAIEAQLGGGGGIPGQGGGGARQYTYLDELGIIVATDVPRKLVQLEEITNRLLEEFNKTVYSRFELTHIAAPVGRERVLQLVGQMAQPNVNQGQINPNIQQQQFNPLGGAQGSLNNIGDRLTVDAQGNALVFRGRPEELQHIRQILEMIDVPNALVPKQYFAGSAARQIADIARGQGLGEVTTIDSLGTGANEINLGGRGFLQQGQQGLQGSASAFSVGGSVMVVDEQRGNIIYYATPSQQERLAALITELDTGSDRETIEIYKLKNSKAEDVADVINNLLSNTQPQGQGSLLPDSGQPARRTFSPPRAQQQGAQGEAGGFALDTNAFVIADVANNQLLVKARAGQQGEFARVIQKLDLRRPQVYVEAKIIAVTTDDRTRLAFENQLINANGTGGVLNTNFGLGTLGTTGSQPILNRKTVASGLSGFTAAIIKSDQIPIVMTALANETDSRVVSTPQLLVDDNEEASVVSIDKQPTSTAQTTDGGNQIVSAGQSAEAGTKLTVTPQISDGGYLRLQYEIELSSFTGEAQTVGNTVLPPPSQVNTLKSESVTVPSDSTVVVGGLVVDQDTKSVAKIPLLGDIPLFGKLFGDERKGDRKTVLYVFLTPRILRDPGFEDLRLLTSGPQAASKIPNEFPSLSPQMIDVNASSFDIPAAAAPAESTPAPVQPAAQPARQQAVPNNGKPVARQVTKVPQTPPPGQPAKPAQEPLNPDD